MSTFPNQFILPRVSNVDTPQGFSNKVLIGSPLTFSSTLLAPGGASAPPAQNHGMPSGWTTATFSMENVDASFGYWIVWTRTGLTSSAVSWAAFNHGPGNAASFLVATPVFYY